METNGDMTVFDRLRWALSVGKGYQSVEEYAHMNLSEGACMVATVLVTVVPYLYLFLWQVHFYMVCKSYHERGKLAVQRK